MGNVSSGIYKGIAKKVDTYDETNGKRTSTLHIGETAFDLDNGCSIAGFISQRLLDAVKLEKPVTVVLSERKKGSSICALKVDGTVYHDGHIPKYGYQRVELGTWSFFILAAAIPLTFGLALVVIIPIAIIYIILTLYWSRLEKKHALQGASLVEELRVASV